MDPFRFLFSSSTLDETHGVLPGIRIVGFPVRAKGDSVSYPVVTDPELGHGPVTDSEFVGLGPGRKYLGGEFFDVHLSSRDVFPGKSTLRIFGFGSRSRRRGGV